MSVKSAKKEALCKLFVGGLRRDTTEDVFREYFCKYGELTDLVIICDKNHVSRGFGFVSYETPEILDSVLVSRPHVVDGKEVDVRRATPKSQMGDPQPKRSPKIFIGGLHKDVTAEEIREYFDSRFYHLGPVKEVDIKKNRDGEPRGFGFVIFENEDVPERVLLEDLDVIFHGKRCNLKAAIPKDQTTKANSMPPNRHSPRRSSREAPPNRGHDYFDDRRPYYPPNPYDYHNDYYDQGSFYPPPPPPPMAGGAVPPYRSNEAYSPQGHVPSSVGERRAHPVPPRSMHGSYEPYNDRNYTSAQSYVPAGGPRGGRSNSGYRGGGANNRPRPY